MPDAKISADQTVANPADADSFPIVSGGANKRMLFSALKSYLQAGLTLFDGTYSSLTGKPSLFSGAYADLTGKPSLFSGAYADLTGKPALFSGAYADLSGKPTLGTAAAQNTGTAVGNVVVVQTGGKIDPSLYTAGGGGSSGPQNNYAATVAPTATDDANAGYAAGSSWMVAATGEMWRCRVATAGVARWVKVDTADHPGYVAGKRYVPFGMGAPVAGVAGVAGTTFMGAGVIKSRITVSELHIRMTTAGATGNYALAIYAHDAVKGGPTGTPLVTSVNGATGAAGPMTVALNANLQLEPGIYWFAYQMDQTTPIYLSQGSGSTNHLALFGSAGHPIGNGAASQASGFSINGTFGTWPDLTSASLTEQSSRAPYVGFTVASVP